MHGDGEGRNGRPPTVAAQLEVEAGQRRGRFRGEA